jgi:predicted Rossmann fold flavoprotein
VNGVPDAAAAGNTGRISADVAVVGGGPSGMMAALAASALGRRTVILERMDRVGKKLLATGNGRCNLANGNPAAGRFHGAGPDFIRRVTVQFGLKEILAFFSSIGLEVRQDEAGRIFPVTDRASTVLDLLRDELKRRHVAECCGNDVDAVQISKSGFMLACGNRTVAECRSVVLAAGGKAAPALGSNGSGFVLARSLGHSIVSPRPALVQICLADKRMKRLKGVRVEAGVTLMDGNTAIRSEPGEIIFTDDGLSGIPVMNLSRFIDDPKLKKEKKPFVQIDLFPRRSGEDLAEAMERRFRTLAHKDTAGACMGLLDKRLIPFLLEAEGLGPDVPAPSAASDGGAPRLARRLKRWTLDVEGTRSWNEAQVTAGGVDTGEVDPATLESKIAGRLFFAGEILDVDGDCGGYNLQWAWSSGFVAGKHAAL